MFDKLLGKSKKTAFELPEKNFNYDSKTVSKLSSKDLILLATDQEKYIQALLKKFQYIRDDYAKMKQKVEELTQKNQIINEQTVRMSNEHQQLTIKYDNLQNALEMTLREKQMMAKQNKSKQTVSVNRIVQGMIDTEVKAYLPNLDTSLKSEDKLAKLLQKLKDQASLSLKIQQQNSKLKQRIQQLQSNYYTLEEKLGKEKQELSNLKQQIDRRDSQIVRLKDAKHELVAENVRLSKVEQKYKLLVNQEEALLSERNSIELSNSELRLQVAKKSKQIQSLNKQIQRLEDFMKTEKSKQGQNQQNMEQFLELNQLKSKLSQLQSSNQQQIKSKSTRISQLESKIQQLQTNNKNTEKLKEQNQIKIQQSLQLQTKLKNQLNKISSQNGQIKAKVVSLQQQIAKLKNISQVSRQLELKIDSLNLQLQGKNTLIIELKNKIEEDFKSGAQQSDKVIKEKERSLELMIEQRTQNQRKYKELQIQHQKSVQHQLIQLKQVNSVLAQKNQQIQELNRKLRKTQNQMNTSNIKMDNLKKQIQKSSNLMKQNKESMEKCFQQNIINLEKIKQLQDMAKEYKREIHKQKSEKLELQQNYQMKIKQMDAAIVQSRVEIETTKRQSNYEHQAKETQLNKKIFRLEQQLQDSTKQNEKIQRQLSEYKQGNMRNQEMIRELSDRRQQAIREIQRLEKLVQEKSGKSSGKSLAPTDIPKAQKEKVQNNNQRSKKIASKGFKAFGIILKLLQGLYKQFVNDYISQIKQERVQKLQNGINQLITKTTDMKDVFKDYL